MLDRVTAGVTVGDQNFAVAKRADNEGWHIQHGMARIKPTNGKRMVSTHIRAAVTSFMFLAVALWAAVSLAEATLPTTAADHEALAKRYREQAAQDTKLADEHRAMADAAKKSASSSHSVVQGGKDPRLDKMVKHCQAISKDADKLAGGATKAAESHEMRAKELQGK